jgi:HD-like signal output (HDOD) protein
MSRIVIILLLVGLLAGVLLWNSRRTRGRPEQTAALLRPPAALPPATAPAATTGPDASTSVPAGAALLARVNALALGDERAADPAAHPDPAHMPLLLAASREIAQIGSEPRYTPRRPSMLPQIMEAVSDEEASMRSLSRLVSQDPELTSELLRTANSPLYRVGSTPVESIERAAAIVGTRGIRTLITAALVKPLAGGAEGAPGRFGDIIWEHSLYSASAAEAYAARSQDCDPYTAHLLGLLHGLGSVAVYRAVMGQYATQPALAPDGPGVSQSLGAQSGVTARRIAANWGLSERTQEALEAQSTAAPTTSEGPLARALRFGHLAGALVLLGRRGEITPAEGRERLAEAGHAGPQVDRIWDRLVKAYVSPK